MSDEIPEIRAAALLESRFVLHEKIGVGACSEIWRAWDTELNRSVAIKFAIPSLVHVHYKWQLSFEREARIQASIRSRNIPHVYQFGKHSLLVYFVMEWLDAIPVPRVRTPWNDVLTIVTSAASTLSEVHAAGVTHRDVKPANMLMAERGLYLVDFGLARGKSGEGPTTRAPIGTPRYMAPECAAGGDIGHHPAGDIYSLGAVAYELLSGDPPHPGEYAREVLDACRRKAPKTLSRKVPARVNNLVMTALERRPEDRFASAAEMRDAFAKVKK